MQNLELKAIVTEVGVDTYTINRFQYKVIKVDFKELKGFKILISLFDTVEVGDCIKFSHYRVTRMGTESNPVDLCLRVDKFEILPSEGFEPSEHLNVKVVGYLMGSSKCFLRTVGPEKKPFFLATLKMQDECSKNFGIMLVSFGNNAKKISTVKFNSLLECVVTIKPKLVDPGYEMATVSLSIVKED